MITPAHQLGSRPRPGWSRQEFSVLNAALLERWPPPRHRTPASPQGPAHKRLKLAFRSRRESSFPSPAGIAANAADSIRSGDQRLTERPFKHHEYFVHDPSRNLPLIE